MAISILTAEGLTKLLQKIKAIFATKNELNAVENGIANEVASQVSTIGTDFVHKTGDEIIAGTKTFSAKINVASNTLLSSELTGISNADETRNASTKKLILELKDKNSKRFFGIESEAATNGSRRIYFHLQKRSNDAWVDGYQFRELADGTIQNIVSTPPASANDTQIATTAFVKTQGYITSSDNITGSSGSCTGNASTATKLATARSLWGNNFDGSAALSGTINGTPAIEFKPSANTSNNGGYLDFHYNQSTADYTSRIIESASGTLSINNVTITTEKVVTAATFTGALSGNASSATITKGNKGTGSYVTSIKSGNALVNADNTAFGSIWNAPTKSYRVACATWPDNGDNIIWYSITNANVSSSTNTTNKIMTWNAGTGILTATGFAGPLTGNVTGNCSGSSGSCTGNAATATKLATARKINGVSFDGSADITVADSTKLPLAGGTVTGATYFTTDYYRKDTGAVKGTAPSSNRWQNGVRFIDNNNVAFGGIERGFLSDGTNRINMIVYKGTTTDTSSNSQIGVGFDKDGNWFTYAPTPATTDNSTKIATTAFVKAQGYLTSQTQLSLTNSGSGNAVTGISVSNHAITVTKGSTFLTSHQSLSNYVTLNSEQNITGTKNLTGFRIYNSGITYNANPSANSFVSMGLCGASLASLSSVTLYVNTDGSKGLMFRLSKYHENSVNSILTIGMSASNVYSVTCYGAIQPGSNNTLSCGTSSRKWTAVYATNATIQTSDEREKDSIEPISDSVLDAWSEVQWCQFQMKSSIKEKGIDNARIHTGTIAQRIKKIFENRGLDPFKYGLLCYDEWESEPEVIDENGNVCDSGCPAGNQYAIRYEEALAIEAAYQRRRADRLEERLSALEKKVQLLMS